MRSKHLRNALWRRRVRIEEERRSMINRHVAVLRVVCHAQVRAKRRHVHRGRVEPLKVEATGPRRTIAHGAQQTHHLRQRNVTRRRLVLQQWRIDRT